MLRTTGKLLKIPVNTKGSLVCYLPIYHFLTLRLTPHTFEIYGIEEKKSINIYSYSWTWHDLEFIHYSTLFRNCGHNNSIGFRAQENKRLHAGLRTPTVITWGSTDMAVPLVSLAASTLLVGVKSRLDIHVWRPGELRRLPRRHWLGSTDRVDPRSAGRELFFSVFTPFST